VALAPALVATHGLAPGAAFRWGAGFGFAVAALGLTWFWNVFGPGSPLLWGMLGVWFGIFFAGRALLERSFTPSLAFAATALWWVAVEFFRAEGYPLRCTFLCLGHALAGGTCPLALAARAVGAYGLGTFIFIVNLGAAEACRLGWDRRRAGLAFAGTAVAALAVLSVTAMWARARAARPDGADLVRVSAVQHEPGAAHEFIALSRDGSGHSPAWILWPEIAVPHDVLADQTVRRQIETLARETKAVVGVGCQLTHPDGPPDFWNAYVLFGPDGRHLGTYTKLQPVPLMNDGVPGSEYPVFATRQGRLGVAICYDGDFSWIPRRLTANGAQVLVIPILDPAAWGERMRRQHLAASVLRAIENDRFVIRPANAPPTVIIDPTGAVTAQLEAPRPGVLSGSVSLRDSRTLYNRYGWLWPYVCQVAAVAALAWAFVRERRRAAATMPRGDA